MTDEEKIKVMMDESEDDFNRCVLIRDNYDLIESKAKELFSSAQRNVREQVLSKMIIKNGCVDDSILEAALNDEHINVRLYAVSYGILSDEQRKKARGDENFEVRSSAYRNGEITAKEQHELLKNDTLIMQVLFDRADVKFDRDFLQKVVEGDYYRFDKVRALEELAKDFDEALFDRYLNTHVEQSIIITMLEKSPLEWVKTKVHLALEDKSLNYAITLNERGVILPDDLVETLFNSTASNLHSKIWKNQIEFSPSKEREKKIESCDLIACIYHFVKHPKTKITHTMVGSWIKECGYYGEIKDVFDALEIKGYKPTNAILAKMRYAKPLEETVKRWSAKMQSDELKKAFSVAPVKAKAKSL